MLKECPSHNDTASPKHIWTYAVGNALNQNNNACPCNSGGTAIVPPYVGSDYYCETGNNAAIIMPRWAEPRGIQ